MADLVAVVPTRGRPGNAQALAQAFGDLCTADIQLVFAVDDDDPALPGYLELPRAFPGLEVCICGPWQPMVSKLNAVAVQVADAGPFAVAFLGDDHRPRTPGFDAAMLAALHDLGTGVVYGDDLMHSERLCSSWAMTSDIIRALGRMVPAPVEHQFCDNAVMRLAERAGCLRYLPHVVIEHMHPLAGKAKWDPGYVQVNQMNQYVSDERAYQKWLADECAGDADKIRALRE